MSGPSAQSVRPTRWVAGRATRRTNYCDIVPLDLPACSAAPGPARPAARPAVRPGYHCTIPALVRSAARLGRPRFFAEAVARRVETQLIGGCSAHRVTPHATLVREPVGTRCRPGRLGHPRRFTRRPDGDGPATNTRRRRRNARPGPRRTRQRPGPGSQRIREPAASEIGPNFPGVGAQLQAPRQGPQAK